MCVFIHKPASDPSPVQLLPPSLDFRLCIPLKEYTRHPKKFLRETENKKRPEGSGTFLSCIPRRRGVPAVEKTFQFSLTDRYKVKKKERMRRRRKKVKRNQESRIRIRIPSLNRLLIVFLPCLLLPVIPSFYFDARDEVSGFLCPN